MLIVFALKAYSYVIWASLGIALVYLTVAAPFVLTARLAIRLAEGIKKWLK